MTGTAPLITPDWLRAQLGHDGLVIIDLRSESLDGGGWAAYEVGHIPGSRHSDYGRDGWRVAKGSAGGALPDEAGLEALFERLGLEPESHVVIVPAGTAVTDFSAAARVYWTLKVAGHGRVSILDGGFAAWVVAGFPLEKGSGPSIRPTHHPVRLDERLRAQVADVEEAIRTRETALVDGRSAASFRGEEKSALVARAGRLPGAFHLDHRLAYDEARHGLKPPEDLAGLFSVVPQGPAVSYCNTGHLASTNWFILSEVLGRPDVRLYDGSMSDWTGDPTRPVEAGEPDEG